VYIDGKDSASLNFARMVGFYTRSFRKSNAAEAVDYLSTICLNGETSDRESKEQIELCHDALRELLLETRDFTTLLGDVRNDGSRVPGAIERKMTLIKITDQREYLQVITEQAAALADNDGRVADAVLLYHLSEEYDAVVAIINKNLGQILSDFSSSQFLHSTVAANANMSLTASANPAQLAKNMIAVYSSNAAIYAKVSLKNRTACGVLLQIMEARTAFENGQWEQCVQLVEGADVIASDRAGDVANIRRRAQAFSSLDESVARCVPVLLLIMLESCAKATESVKSLQFVDAGRVGVSHVWCDMADE